LYTIVIFIKQTAIMKPAFSLLFILLSSVLLCSKSDAQIWQWGRTTADTGSDSWAVAADGAGNVYCAGLNFNGNAVNFGGGVTLPHSGYVDQSIWVKYNSLGVPLWAGSATSYGTVGSAYIFNIATDHLGNLIIFGAFSGDSMSIGSFTLLNANVSPDAQYFLAKIDPSGRVLWAVNDGNVNSGYISSLSCIFLSAGAVTTDAIGNIYITSSFKDSVMTIGSTSLVNHGLSGTYDVFIAKYTPAGVPVWATSCGGTSNDYAFGMTVTPSGYVYITGDFSSTTFTVGSTTLTNSYSHPHAYIAKCSPAGSMTWGQSGGAIQGAYGIELTSDRYNNVYMLGSFADTTITFGTKTLTRTYPNATPQLALYLMQYSPADTVVWWHTIGAPTVGVQAYSISMAGCDKIGIAGSYTQPIVFGAGDTLWLPLTSTISSPEDPLFIAEYYTSGSLISHFGLNSGGEDQSGVAGDESGNLYLTSDCMRTTAIILGPGDTIKVDPAAPESLYIGKYGNFISGDTTTITTDTTLSCVDTTTTLHGTPGYEVYVWDNGSMDSVRTVTDSGTYFVMNIRCGDTILIDTFHVHHLSGTSPSSIALSGPGDAGYGSSVTITATITGGGSGYIVRWFDNGVEFTTTTTPSVTYTKGLGNDTITGELVPATTCFDSSTSSLHIVNLLTTGVSILQSGNTPIIYPNPTNNALHIDGVATGVLYKIQDIVGTTIMENTLNKENNSISLRSLPPGIYILELVPVDGVRSMTKIVKQ
jgi:Secretion system C-terminal sorting domain